MTPEEMRFIEEQERQMNATQSQAQQYQINQAQQNQMMQEQERSMIKDQLDLDEELELIENLLRGKVRKLNKDGSVTWSDPDDSEMVILSEHGIHLIMNTITFYINKNTLLSNYDEETINTKMEDFSTDLADTIFMEYEKVFQYPTFQDCKKVLLERIEKKKQLRKFALELMDEKVDEKSIEKSLIDEIEGQIDREITKIKEQIIKNKLKRFLIILRTIQDAIHSTYLRAWKGQERTTLRQHIHISESRGGNQMPPQRAGGFNPLSWVKSR